MLRLIPLPCPTEQSFPVDHLYFEVVYGPLLGPAAVLVARNLDRRLATAKGPVMFEAVALALEIGLRSNNLDPLGRRSHLRRAIDRLAHHRLVHWMGPTDLGLARSVSIVSADALRQLPPAAVLAHQRLVGLEGA
ncbi:hypothetical protein KSP35_19450 [Aquihabitans sp. G128]|jgi:hypothetical protein|uniref:hypothetical protein n=1 Tax=Aquihabitans sp. G128 TaxID=2849779 RepID=UPI001C24EA9E|nr:hypothetical protein [Aquihabitans sp. G128]QXC60474.1 hypothetical protein KSP35_19450 [Aquihabitans sp. G128]